MVVASGVNRVDEAQARRGWRAAAVRRADPDTVKQATGYSIGGVPPIGLASPLAIYVDRDLLRLRAGLRGGGRAGVRVPDRAGRAGAGDGGQIVDVKQDRERFERSAAMKLKDKVA